MDKMKPLISIIAAVDDRWNLAIDGKLPWKRQLADKNYYLQKVSGHTIIMGSKTYSSADHSRKGNRIVIISRQDPSCFKIPKEDILDSIDTISTIKPQDGENEIFITGGGSIFSAAENEIADRIYLNIIYTDGIGEGRKIKFPKLDTDNRWKLLSSEEVPADKDNDFSSKFMVFERISH